LRANLDAEVLKQKCKLWNDLASDRLLMLEEERDFFRIQTMKLNDEVNQLV